MKTKTVDSFLGIKFKHYDNIHRSKITRPDIFFELTKIFKIKILFNRINIDIKINTKFFYFLKISGKIKGPKLFLKIEAIKRH